MINSKGLTILLLSFLTLTGCMKNKEEALTKPKNSTEQKIDSLLAEMTLEEKVGQLNLINGFWDVTGPVPEDSSSQQKYDDIKNGLVGAMLNVNGVEQVRRIQELAVENSRLKIPMLFGYDVIHGYQTMMPIPLAESCTWDANLMEKSAAFAAKEAASSGINWTFAPMVDISRDARWGRVMEGAGEDTYLGTIAAAARVKGFQGDLSSNLTIAACAKHFAGYGFAEAGLDYNTTEISDHTLHNVVLPPFHSAADAGVATFMNGFNDLGGIPVTANEYIQRDILKDKWGFNGFIVSDWGSIKEIIDHGMAADKKQAADIAIHAGSDMDMEGNCYHENLADLVRENKVSVDLVDDAVRRILKVKFDLGLFDDPFLYCNEEREQKNLGSTDALEFAHEIAKKSIVLLKNEDAILPLKKEESIALIGTLAFDKDSPLGSWRAKAVTNSAVSVEEGLAKKTQNLKTTKGVEVFVGETIFLHELEINETDRDGIKEAVKVARKVDKVVMVLGEHGFQSGEGRSRTNIGLPGLQLELLKEVYKVNKNVVLVLMNGRPLALEWEAANIPAIVETWHLGNKSGDAIADVLFGDENPSGKLTMSFPRNVGQVPLYYNRKNTGRPNSYEFNPKLVFYSHYSDVDKFPLFPFGHGLSYTSFEYSNFSLDKKEMYMDETLTIKVTIENTGERAGEEVVQLYFRDPVASETRPIKELVKYEKISLDAGESKTVKFTITSNDIGFYKKGKFVTELGTFNFFVGTDSRNVLTEDFALIEELKPEK